MWQTSSCQRTGVAAVFPVDPAEVYKNNRLNKDRVWPNKSEPDPQHRVTVFEVDSKPYLHLDNGGYLRQIPALLDLDKYGVFSKDSLFLMARGGQVYLLEPHAGHDNSPSKVSCGSFCHICSSLLQFQRASAMSAGPT